MKYITKQDFDRLTLAERVAIPANEHPLSTADFRRAVKTSFPHAKVSIRTVSFSDLARCSKQCLTVTGDRRGELALINQWARRAGVLPDGNIRCFPSL